MKFFLVLNSLLIIGVTYADEMKISGFINAVGQVSDTGAQYRSLFKNKVDFSNSSNAGLTFHKKISNDWSVQLQLEGKPSDNSPSDVNFDLIQLSWNPKNDLFFRVGRIRIPMWIVAEYINIAHLYPWVSPPTEVYSINYVRSFSGVFGSKRFVLNDWEFIVDLFYGEAGVNVEGEKSTTRGKAFNGRGLSISAIINDFKIHSSYIITKLEANVETSLSTLIAGTNSTILSQVLTPLNIDSLKFFTVGFHFDNQTLLLLAEGTQLKSESAMLKHQKGVYGTVGYYLWGKSFMPHFTYSKLLKAESSQALFTDKSITSTLGLNYYNKHHSVFKIEYGQIKVTQGTGNFDRLPNDKVQVVKIAASTVF